MTMEFGNLLAEAVQDGMIAPDEVLELRRLGWADGRFDPDEAEALFAANEACREPGPEWCDFFVEALTSFIVHTVEPRGYVDAEMGDELIGRIDRDGQIGTMAELELLVRVIEVATSVPQVLRDYALKQLETAVTTGDGPTRYGALDPRGINRTEVALLRRLIFGSGSESPAGVSKTEAEMLFRIKDAALYEPNAPEWQDLFVKGVAQFLLGFAGNEALPQGRAAELESFMAREGAGIGAFLSRMVTAPPDTDGFGSLLGSGEGEAEYLDEIDNQAGVAVRLELAEQAWLQDRLEADEELDEMERALIAFIDAETGETFVPRPKG